MHCAEKTREDNDKATAAKEKPSSNNGVTVKEEPRAAKIPKTEKIDKDVDARSVQRRRFLFNHLLASGYSYFPTADQRPEVLTWGVKLRIYYSCEYLLLHEAFAHYFMILGLTKIWIRLFLPC